MRSLLRQLATVLALLAVAAFSLLLLYYARWVHGIAEGDRALADQDYAAAGRAYEMAEARAGRFFVPEPLLRPGMRTMLFNHARILETSHDYNALARLLEGVATRIPALTGDPEYHYWMGVVEYRKAVSQADKQVLRAGLERADNDFRLALAAAPNDWDTKYNYELIARLLDGMRNKKEESQQKLNRGGMKVLREDEENPKQQPQKLAPNKQS